MQRKTIIAGNWKMNLLPAQAKELTTTLVKNNQKKENLEIILFPQLPLLEQIVTLTSDSFIQVGSQNSSHQNEGAFTGDTSPRLIHKIGCTYTLVGHSERRQFFKETEDLIIQKTQKAIDSNLIPMICIGETLQERESGNFQEVIKNQISSIYKNIPETIYQSLVFAYEPIWAIGTGKSASSKEAEDMHQFIRSSIQAFSNENIASKTSLLYGGSVKPENSSELLQQNNIDGLLVGGASLKIELFQKIIDSYSSKR